MGSSRLSSSRPTTRRDRLAREQELKNKIDVQPRKNIKRIIIGMLPRFILIGILPGLIFTLVFYLINYLIK